MKLERYFENPKILHIGCEENRAYYIPFSADYDAIHLTREKSNRFISLNGEWKFRLYTNIYERENLFENWIEFDTIHGVKGETHDATLYLETDRQGASDLNRILPYYGVGKLGSSNLFDYSRKLAYVGMSRPKKLLCVAMQAKTYEKSKGTFNDDWEIIDLRE